MSMMCGNHFIAYSMHAYEELLLTCMMLPRMVLVDFSIIVFYLLQHRPFHFTLLLN